MRIGCNGLLAIPFSFEGNDYFHSDAITCLVVNRIQRDMHFRLTQQKSQEFTYAFIARYYA
ncbi:hypothetical protein SMGES_25940 [Serratia marcescens]|nr:hypothetical protein SMGES_25940 [Serratia marcescens]